MVTGLNSDQSSKELLEELSHEHPKVILQVVPAEMLAGEEHARLVAQQSVAAMQRNSLYAHRAHIDLLLRLTCSRQIHQALEMIKKVPRGPSFAVVAIGSRHDLSRLKRTLQRKGRIDDSLLELTERKKIFLIDLHGISQKELAATVGIDEPLPWILAERSATLGA